MDNYVYRKAKLGRIHTTGDSSTVYVCGGFSEIDGLLLAYPSNRIEILDDITLSGEVRKQILDHQNVSKIVEFLKQRYKL